MRLIMSLFRFVEPSTARILMASRVAPELDFTFTWNIILRVCEMRAGYGEGRLPFGNRPSWVQGLDLNQGPSGYEPDELPDCSTLQHR